MKKGVTNAVCGTTTKYRMGCRCDLCKNASIVYWKEFRSKNKDKLLLSYKKQHIKHKEKRNKQSRDYGKANASRRSLDMKDKRRIVLNHYSNGTMACNCCGENIYDFLSLDHINGGGNQHRKKEKGRLEPKLIKANFPDGYQVLCHNCNMGKRFNNNICPHKLC